MAKKIRLTRKQIKRPDEFITWSEKAWDWAAQNGYYVLAGIAGILLLFVIIQGSMYMIRGRSSKPEAMLGEAIDIMRAPIIPPTQAPPVGLPHYYSSDPERLEAAARALAELTDQYGSSTEGQLALMYLGETWEQLRDYVKAGEYYQKFLQTEAAGAQPYLKLGATMGLGRALFEQKKNDEALARFDEVIKANGAFKDAALIAAARAWFVKGDKAKSETLLAQARKEFPDSFNARSAGFLVAYWEKNPPKPGESKPLQVPATAAGLDLNALPVAGGTATPATPPAVPAATITPSAAPGGTQAVLPAKWSFGSAPAVGGTAPGALPAPVPPPETPAAPSAAPAPAPKPASASPSAAPASPASPAPPVAPTTRAGQNPAPAPAPTHP